MRMDLNKSQHSKTYSDKKKILGLCVQCGIKSTKDLKTTCEDCIANRKIQYNKLRSERKNLGLCPNDGFVVEQRGNVLCNRCLNRCRFNSKSRKSKNIELGFCSHCGKNSPEKYGYCSICFLKNTSARHFGNRKRWTEIHKIFKQQKGLCPYTGRLLILGNDASLDHIIPKSKGGSDESSNLQWVYAPINLMKLNHLEEDFMNLIKQVYEHKNKHKLNLT